METKSTYFSNHFFLNGEENFINKMISLTIFMYTKTHILTRQSIIDEIIKAYFKMKKKYAL